MSRCENCSGCGPSVVRTLASYRVGFRGRVNRILPSLSSRKRMLEMGLTPGTVVEIVGTAPMGDPLEISLRGYRLSLRREEAGLVEVSSLSLLDCPDALGSVS
jgi:Fe2+ transport system protein FeoA